jgi:hypothetical protein
MRAAGNGKEKGSTDGQPREHRKRRRGRDEIEVTLKRARKQERRTAQSSPCSPRDTKD